MAPSDPPNGTCGYPYLGFPTCTETYADSMGASFTIFHGIYGTVAAVLFAAALVCYVRIANKLGTYDPRNNHLVLIFLMNVIGACMCARLIDPLTWGGITPQWVDGLLFCNGSNAAMTAAIMTYMSWIRFYSRTSFSRRLESFIRYPYYICLVVLWTVPNVLVLLSYLMGPYYALSGLRYMIYTVILCVWAFFGSIFGITVYRSLDLAQKRYLALLGMPSAAVNYEATAAAFVVPQVAITSKGEARRNERNRELHRVHVLRRLLRMIHAAVILTVIATAVLVYVATVDFVQKIEFDAHLPPTPSNIELFKKFLPELVHILMLIAGIVAFGQFSDVTRHLDNNSGGASSNRTSSVGMEKNMYRIDANNNSIHSESDCKSDDALGSVHNLTRLAADSGIDLRAEGVDSRAETLDKCSELADDSLPPSPMVDVEVVQITFDSGSGTTTPATPDAAEFV
ncbi:hypothetical protein CAOG_08436 [Capsaspora owczarzaki ATCC 30864]|uniref:Uncharacterized protein n=1 Tax=Capsaspora owczarzaki (strain ATCC 30864) TaxID=595528 RepID=A0A0D2X0J3_CAPO3|nr:hypothetical protein CAOG_08436 [Capsaspora owczarzaki ATCC 30864]KJE89159.1 hypothetical protein CAOG_008436 [Capsaspora owczarzaki ATCC 30864]|eukprot:XP_011270007.1 hypothetical protein CAOG_08436 [Capsaspora owczarzaki ATCC 30864]